MSPFHHYHRQSDNAAIFLGVYTGSILENAAPQIEPSLFTISFLHSFTSSFIKWVAHYNTNVESRSLSVVKYIINNIMSTALTGRRKTATYLHLVRELLYDIDWPYGRLLTYWHFVHI